MNPTAPMTQARFEALAEAYGGDVARWPVEAREEATLTLAEAPAFARAVLAAASSLDAALDNWRPQPASHDLREAILAAAPRARPGGGAFAWLFRAGLGAGLAAACAVGVVVGMQVTLLAQPPAEVEVLATALKGYETVALGAADGETAG